MIVYYQSHAWELKELARKLNLNPRLLRQRIERGWSIEKSIKAPIKSHEREITDHLGNHFNSIKELCQFHHFNEKLFRYRRYAGWSVERILTTPKQRKAYSW